MMKVHDFSAKALIIDFGDKDTIIFIKQREQSHQVKQTNTNRTATAHSHIITNILTKKHQQGTNWLKQTRILR